MSPKITLALKRSRSLLRKERFFWVLIVNGEPIARSAGGYANAGYAADLGRRVASGTYENYEFVDQTGR